MEPLPTSQFYGQFRIGRVSAFDETNHRLQVKFFEQDGFTSWDFPVLVTASGDYSIPAKDTPVLCLIVDGRLGVGYVLGVVYTDSDQPPGVGNRDYRAVAGDDLRLGDPLASDFVALASKCNSNFDDIKSEFDAIKTTLGSLTGGAMAPATFGTPYTTVGYSPEDVDAAKVKAR